MRRNAGTEAALASGPNPLEAVTEMCDAPDHFKKKFNFSKKKGSEKRNSLVWAHTCPEEHTGELDNDGNREYFVPVPHPIDREGEKGIGVDRQGSGWPVAQANEPVSRCGAQPGLSDCQWASDEARTSVCVLA